MSSPKSYERVHYLLRPRKQIERKIMIGLLSQFDDISRYQYVGMGAIFYADFILLYKHLGISDMISLEKFGGSRCKFNRPYDFITFLPKSTTDFLRTRRIRRRSILWFDYDEKLFEFESSSPRSNEDILTDIELVTRKTPPNTIFILTLDVTAPPLPEEQEAFRETFDEFLPSSFKDQSYRTDPESFKTDYRYMIQEVVLNLIEEHSKHRPAKFLKLFSFCYRDGGSPMYTLGGVFDIEEHHPEYAARFADNEFVSSSPHEIREIDVPILTYREKMLLDAHLVELRSTLRRSAKGRGKSEMLRILGFELGSVDTLRSYLTYHKYYPQYHESYL